MCCNVSGQSWMNSIKRKGFAFEKSAEFIGSECFQRLHINVQAEESEFQTSGSVRIWSKWRHIFSLFWWTGTLLRPKWSERTYLRDKQFKKNIHVMVQEIAPWNLSDAWRRNRITTTTRTAIPAHFYWYILISRIESLRSEAQLNAGKKNFHSVSI